MSVIRDEIAKLLEKEDPYQTLNYNHALEQADKIISLIESKLPMVVEWCPECKGRGKVSCYSDESFNCKTCNETGKTSHSMTLDEAIERLKESP